MSDEELNKELSDAPVEKEKRYDMTQTFIAVLMTCGYLAFHYYLLTHVVDPTMKEMVSTSLNTIDTAFVFIIGFYFGSSLRQFNKTKE